MSDHDRGAYTPQSDEPLAFDARRPSERRPMPMTLIGSALVLVLLIGGVALVYRGGVRGAGEGPRPVGQPVMSVKTAANVSPAANATASDQDVYAEARPAAPSTVAQGNEAGATAATTTTSTTTTSAAAPSTAPAPATPLPTAPATMASSAPAPTFAPSAEQPAARPKPSAKTLAMMAPPRPSPHARPVVVATTRTVAPSTGSTGGLDASEVAAAGMTRSSERAASIKVAEAAPAPSNAALKAAALAAAKTRRAAAAAEEEDGAAPASAAATTATAAPAAVAAAAAGHTGPSVVQIGAFSSSALADKGYADVSADMTGRMAGKSKHVMTVDKDGKTLYRTWVAGFASRPDAIAFCEALKAKSKSCIVKG